MISYGDTVSRAVVWAQRQAWFADLSRVVLVRDLLGRVRLVAEGRVADSAEQDMQAELGGWSGGVLSTASQPAECAIAKRILDEASPWPSRWPSVVSDGFGNDVDVDKKWRAFERVGGKESWLDSEKANPPWPLHNKTPGIATFYSFKGGVGRTTALALTAAILANRGQRVLCIDLDLEAPGLADAFKVEPLAGALDLLLHHHVYGSLDPSTVEEAIYSTAIGDSSTLSILPAARIDNTYIERVARLDYLSAPQSGVQSPVENGINEILKLVKSRYDVILLDARAGIHDLGGLAMLSVSHAAVIVFRPDLQTLSGLELVLPAYARRRSEDERRLVMAASFVSPDADLRPLQLENWRQRVYDRCTERGSIYDGLEDLPGLDDGDVPHDLVPLVESAQLSANETLQDHATPPTDLSGYSLLAERLEAVLASEETS